MAVVSSYVAKRHHIKEHSKCTPRIRLQISGLKVKIMQIVLMSRCIS